MESKVKGGIRNPPAARIVPPVGAKAYKFGDPGLDVTGVVLLSGKAPWELRDTLVNIVSHALTKSKHVVSTFSVVESGNRYLVQLFKENGSGAGAFIYLREETGRVHFAAQSRFDMKKTLKGLEGEAPSLRPRWAEENRPKKQVKLRLDPALIDELDGAASKSDMTRNDWIEAAIRQALTAKPK